jgi:hypothetical protein
VRTKHLRRIGDTEQALYYEVAISQVVRLMQGSFFRCYRLRKSGSNVQLSLTSRFRTYIPYYTRTINLMLI